MMEWGSQIDNTVLSCIWGFIALIGLVVAVPSHTQTATKKRVLYLKAIPAILGAILIFIGLYWLYDTAIYYTPIVTERTPAAALPGITAAISGRLVMVRILISLGTFSLVGLGTLVLCRERNEPRILRVTGFGISFLGLVALGTLFPDPVYTISRIILFTGWTTFGLWLIGKGFVLLRQITPSNTPSKMGLILSAAAVAILAVASLIAQNVPLTPPDLGNYLAYRQFISSWNLSSDLILSYVIILSVGILAMFPSLLSLFKHPVVRKLKWCQVVYTVTAMALCSILLATLAMLSVSSIILAKNIHPPFSFRSEFDIAVGRVLAVIFDISSLYSVPLFAVSTVLVGLTFLYGGRREKPAMPSTIAFVVSVVTGGVLIGLWLLGAGRLYTLADISSLVYIWIIAAWSLLINLVQLRIPNGEQSNRNESNELREQDLAEYENGAQGGN